MPISNSEVISVMAICVSAATALIVAHLHRKQMRQIEAHRTDPSVDLKPPPGPVLAFFRKYQSLILGIVLPTGTLVFNLFNPSPITRTTIVLMAALVCGILTNALVMLEDRYTRHMLRMIDGLSTILDSHFEAITGHQNLIVEQQETLKLLADTVKRLTEAVLAKK